ALPLLESGVIIRHLVLPSHKDDSIALLHWIKTHLPEGQYLLSLMSQYTPYGSNKDCPELNRHITTYEYNRVIDTAVSLGLTQGYMQQKSSAGKEYTPPFHLEGL
ncbi:MAG: radical SAM protein, partial [Clostridiales bacterium]|nr:radical SAM protein [Clostridiales bacterium]